MAAYSGSTNFNQSIEIPNCTIGDIITIEFYSEYSFKSGNFTASFSEGSLNIDPKPPLNGAYTYATSSIQFGNFISASVSPNVLIFNASLSSFFGTYLQVPAFLSGSSQAVSISSSLYSTYGEINNPFNFSIGDKIVLYGVDGRYQILEVSSTNAADFSDNKRRVYVSPNLNSYFLLGAQNIGSCLIVKKLKDEQNIILSFKKSPGDTSYGFVIPENISLDILNNIASIQSNVQNQLLSTQQNSG